MTPDEILALLLINISIATSVLRQLGFVISRAALGGKSLHITSYTCASEYMKTYRQAQLVSVGRPLSSACSHRASVLIAELTTQCLCSVCPVSAEGVTQRSTRLSLTALGTAGEEVSGHFSLPLHLHHTSTVQLVAIVDQHVVEVRGHLREDTEI